MGNNNRVVIDGKYLAEVCRIVGLGTKMIQRANISLVRVGGNKIVVFIESALVVVESVTEDERLLEIYQEHGGK